MDRYEIAKIICNRLNDLDLKILKNQFLNSCKINYLIIENLLPNNLAKN